MLKIASFNVNSIRSRQTIVLKWLKKAAPDVLCVQETKAQDADFPVDAFAESGYQIAFKGQKSYNGVAIFSRQPIDDVHCGLDDKPQDQARMIRAAIAGVHIVNTYIPQGYEVGTEKFAYKLQWFERLGKYFKKHFKPTDLLVWVGDLNIAPEDRDVYAPDRLRNHVCFHEDVKKALAKIKAWGFVDVFRKHNDQDGQFTFWDYRMRGGLNRNQGWRLDHILATKPLAGKSTACYIDKEPRMLQKPSDHTPIIAEFAI